MLNVYVFVCSYWKWLKPLLNDKSFHQVSQNLPALGPRLRLPGAAQRLVEALRDFFGLAEGLGLGGADRRVDLLRLVPRQAEVSGAGGPRGQEGRGVFCRRGDEG